MWVINSILLQRCVKR